MIVIFMNYRHKDSAAEAARIFDALVASGIPASEIYFDQNEMVNPPGAIFPEEIVNALKEARVLLVIIGPQWEMETTSVWRGLRRIPRLKDVNDWVRREIELGIEPEIEPGSATAADDRPKAQPKLIVPILVRGRDIASLKKRRIPKSIYHMLHNRNMLPLDNRAEHFAIDIEHIFNSINAKMALRYKKGSNDGAKIVSPSDVSVLYLDPAQFKGRSEDLQWASAHILPQPTTEIGAGTITAIFGMGGIGKSALAGQIIKKLSDANAFPDGIAVVACREMRDPSAVLRSVIARFKKDAPQEADLQALTDLAREVFHQKHALVVLDNVEPDWDVGLVINPLRLAGVNLLLTSREQLPTQVVPNEASRKLALLTPEEAVRVFNVYYRQQADQPGDTLQPQQQNAAKGRIVLALGYHTLAIKLAASAAQGQDLEGLATSYEANPRLGVHLKEGNEGVYVVFASSFATLSLAAQQLLILLGAFGAADVGQRAALYAAEELGDEQARNSLQEILKKMLADPYFNQSLPEKSDHDRLRLHPLIKAMAQELLHKTQSAVEQENIAQAIATWYATYTDLDLTSDLALVADEQNINHALDASYIHQFQRQLYEICQHMRFYWLARWSTKDTLTYLPKGIAAAKSLKLSIADWVELTRDYCTVLRRSGDFTLAEATIQATLRIARAQHARKIEGIFLTTLAQMEWPLARLAEAEKHFREALAIISALPGSPPYEIAPNYTGLGRVLLDMGRLPEAEEHTQQALAIWEALYAEDTNNKRYHREIGTDECDLGLVALARGDVTRAKAKIDKALAIAKDVGNPLGVGVALSGLAKIAELRADWSAAEQFYQQSLDLRIAVQDRWGEGREYINLGRMAEQLGRFTQAEEYYRLGMRKLQAIGDQIYYAGAALAYGKFLVLQRKNREEGCALIQQGYAIFQRLSLPQMKDAENALRACGCPTAASK